MSKIVYLTFDDGPNEPYTSQILDVLKKEKVKATFFVCGANAEFYPETIKKIARDGHLLGNHAYFHSRLFSLLWLFKPNSLYQQINKTEETLTRIVGKRTPFFRPPYGIFAWWQKKKIAQMGKKLILWQILVPDWKKKSTVESMVKLILHKINNETIIVMHDGQENHHGIDHSKTVSLLRKIIPFLKHQGYLFKSLPEN